MSVAAQMGLPGEIIRLELLLLVPADLTGDEHHPSAGHQSVAVTLGPRPSRRLKYLHCESPLFPVAIIPRRDPRVSGMARPDLLIDSGP